MKITGAQKYTATLAGSTYPRSDSWDKPRQLRAIVRPGTHLLGIMLEHSQASNGLAASVYVNDLLYTVSGPNRGWLSIAGSLSDTNFQPGEGWNMKTDFDTRLWSGVLSCHQSVVSNF